MNRRLVLLAGILAALTVVVAAIVIVAERDGSAALSGMSDDARPHQAPRLEMRAESNAQQSLAAALDDPGPRPEVLRISCLVSGTPELRGTPYDLYVLQGSPTLDDAAMARADELVVRGVIGEEKSFYVRKNAELGLRARPRGTALIAATVTTVTEHTASVIELRLEPIHTVTVTLSAELEKVGCREIVFAGIAKSGPFSMSQLYTGVAHYVFESAPLTTANLLVFDKRNTCLVSHRLKPDESRVTLVPR